MRGYRRDGFHAFSEYSGFSMLENPRSAIDQAVKRQKDDYILNVNREEYIQHLVSEFSIEPIEIHKDGLSVSTHEEMIPAEMHPRSYFVDRGGSYPRDVLVFHLPFTGDQQLLKVRASTYSMSTPLITVEQGCICFKIINFNLEAQQIKQESEQTIQSLVTQNDYLTNDLEKFNASIEQHASRKY